MAIDWRLKMHEKNQGLRFLWSTESRWKFSRNVLLYETKPTGSCFLKKLPSTTRLTWWNSKFILLMVFQSCPIGSWRVLYYITRIPDRRTVWGHAPFLRRKVKFPNEMRIESDGIEDSVIFNLVETKSIDICWLLNLEVGDDRIHHHLWLYICIYIYIDHVWVHSCSIPIKRGCLVPACKWCAPVTGAVGYVANMTKYFEKDSERIKNVSRLVKASWKIPEVFWNDKECVVVKWYLGRNKQTKDCMINESNFRNFRVIGDQRIAVNVIWQSIFFNRMHEEETYTSLTCWLPGFVLDRSTGTVMISAPLLIYWCSLVIYLLKSVELLFTRSFKMMWFQRICSRILALWNAVWGLVQTDAVFERLLNLQLQQEMLLCWILREMWSLSCWWMFSMS